MGVGQNRDGNDTLHMAHVTYKTHANEIIYSICWIFSVIHNGLFIRWQGPFLSKNKVWSRFLHHSCSSICGGHLTYTAQTYKTLTYTVHITFMAHIVYMGHITYMAWHAWFIKVLSIIKLACWDLIMDIFVIKLKKVKR